jgi:GxxExxY protein
MTQIISNKNKSSTEHILFPELSYQLMSIMFEVHNQLGPGYTEDIYEKAVVYELKCRGIAYEEQKPILVTYKGQPMGYYRLDLVIDEKIILELKAVSSLNDLFKQQLLSYLKATDLRLGLLINFGSMRVEYLRIVN